MRVGQAYIVHCGDWHTYVGRVQEQIGPWLYLMTHCSKVYDTHNGDNWEALAAGDAKARKAAEYRHYTTPVEIPLTIAAILWNGKLPQEEKAA